MRQLAAFALFLLLPAIALAQAEDGPALTTAHPEDYVSDVLPYPKDKVRARVAQLFDSDARDYYDDYNGAIYQLPAGVHSARDLPSAEFQNFLSFPLVRPAKFYVFLGAYPVAQGRLRAINPFSVMGESNAALQRYALLPKPARADDFYLWSPDLPFWESEYMYEGRTVPFRSYFIVHLAAMGTNRTAVEIIEDKPVADLGPRLSVDEHGIVHQRDQRAVDPTTGDRTLLLSCIRQFLDRKVPGRHWFSCRDPNAPPEPEAVPFTVP